MDHVWGGLQEGTRTGKETGNCQRQENNDQREKCKEKSILKKKKGGEDNALQA